MIVFAAIGEFFGLARQVVEIDQGLRTWGQFSPLDALWTAGAAGLIPFAPILIPIFGVAGVGSAGYQLWKGNFGLAAFDGLFSIAGFRGWGVAGFPWRPTWPVKGITPASSGTGTPNPAPTIASGERITPTPGGPGGAGGQRPGLLDPFPPGARAGTGEPNGNPSQPNVPNVRPTPEEVTVGATPNSGTQKGQSGDGADSLPNTPKVEPPQEATGSPPPTSGQTARPALPHEGYSYYTRGDKLLIRRTKGNDWLPELELVNGQIQPKTGWDANRTASNAAIGFENLQCMECAARVQQALQAAGFSGRTIDIYSGATMRMPANIYSERLGYNISTNGYHRAVRIGDLVYDNHNPNGTPYDVWMNDLHWHAKTYGFEGDSITETLF